MRGGKGQIRRGKGEGEKNGKKNGKGGTHQIIGNERTEKRNQRERNGGEGK